MGETDSDQSGDETSRGERAKELAAEIRDLMYTEQEAPNDRFSDHLDNAQSELEFAAELEGDA